MATRGKTLGLATLHTSKHCTHTARTTTQLPQDVARFFHFPHASHEATMDFCAKLHLITAPRGTLLCRQGERKAQHAIVVLLSLDVVLTLPRCVANHHSEHALLCHRVGFSGGAAPPSGADKGHSCSHGHWRSEWSHRRLLCRQGAPRVPCGCPVPRHVLWRAECVGRGS